MVVESDVKKELLQISDIKERSSIYEIQEEDIANKDIIVKIGGVKKNRVTNLSKKNIKMIAMQLCVYCAEIRCHGCFKRKI